MYWKDQKARKVGAARFERSTEMVTFRDLFFFTFAQPKRSRPLANRLPTFQALNFLTDRTFANQDQAKTPFVDFIESRAPNFYGDVINRLVLRWQKCTD